MEKHLDLLEQKIAELLAQAEQNQESSKPDTHEGQPEIAPKALGDK